LSHQPLLLLITEALNLGLVVWQWQRCAVTESPDAGKNATSVGMVHIAITAAGFEAFQAATPECAEPMMQSRPT
jgi:hypothetical protein